MSERLNIAIVGGGIVGCCLAWELSKIEKDIYLFEKNQGITKGENQTSRNSGVNHSGINYDQKTRPLKAQLCVKGNRLWYEFCQRYDIPCLKTGKLMVASNEEKSFVLDQYLKRAIENNVPDVEKISGEEVKKLEPNVSAHSALLVPTSGIFDPTALVQKVSALAINNGVQFITETKVVGLKPVNGGIELRIRYRDGKEDATLAKYVINAAGINAVLMARMVDPDIPVNEASIRGDSLKFYRTRRPELHLRGMNIYPTPIVINSPTGRHHTVGVHLTPTLDTVGSKTIVGNTVTVGPKLVQIHNFEDHKTPVPPPEAFLEETAFFPALSPQDLQFHQSGIQARLKDYPDFYIKRDRVCEQVIHLLGIDSPGLTSAPAIAQYVRNMIEK